MDGDLVYVREKRRSKVKGQRQGGGIPEDGGRRTEDRCQKSDVRGQRTEVGGRRSEDRDQKPEVGGLIGKNYRIVRYWKSGDYKPGKFYWGWMPPHPTFFVRRSVYEKYGFFNLELGSAADYELMLRFLLKHKITTTYIHEVLVKMRSGGASNASLKNRLRANRMDRLAWKVNGLRPYPWTLWMKPLRKVGQYLRKS